jgi:hypothetical protein
MTEDNEGYKEEVKLNGPIMEEWINEVLKIENDDQSLVPRKVRDVSDQHRTASHAYGVDINTLAALGISI